MPPDTLASLASEKSPLKSSSYNDFSFQGQRRPRAYSESYVNTSSWNTAASILPEVNEDITVPSMLDQYTSMYNKNGRIGIYTKKERIEIIERFREKRSRRVWRKKIRYHCRKNLADKRIRIKGRFVKKTEDVPGTENENDSSSVDEGMGEEVDESLITITDIISEGGNDTKKPEISVEMPTVDDNSSKHKVSVITEPDGTNCLETQGEGYGHEHQGTLAPEEGYERMRRHSIAY